MQLTLVIRKSGRSMSNMCKTVQSFKHEDIELQNIIFIDKLTDIDYGKINSDWWIILHDDELIAPELLEAVIVASQWEQFEAFVFYKKDTENKVTICPRMFRKHIRLELDMLYPIMPVKMEVLLNGWILEH